MRIFSQTQNNIVARGANFDVIGFDNRAIGDAPCKFSPILSSEAQLVANVRAQAVGADQEIGVVAGLGHADCQSD